MWTAQDLARASGIWPPHPDYLAVFTYNHYHLLMQETHPSRKIFMLAGFSNVRILRSQVIPAFDFNENEEAKNYYYIFHYADYDIALPINNSSIHSEKD